MGKFLAIIFTNTVAIGWLPNYVDTTPQVITGGSYSTTSDINFNTIITFTTTSDIKFNINVGSITYIVVSGGASSGTVQNGKAQGGKAGSNGIGGLGG